MSAICNCFRRLCGRRDNPSQISSRQNVASNNFSRIKLPSETLNAQDTLLALQGVFSAECNIDFQLEQRVFVKIGSGFPFIVYDGASENQETFRSMCEKIKQMIPTHSSMISNSSAVPSLFSYAPQHSMDFKEKYPKDLNEEIKEIYLEIRKIFENRHDVDFQQNADNGDISLRMSGSTIVICNRKKAKLRPERLKRKLKKINKALYAANLPDTDGNLKPHLGDPRNAKSPSKLPTESVTLLIPEMEFRSVSVDSKEPPTPIAAAFTETALVKSGDGVQLTPNDLSVTSLLGSPKGNLRKLNYHQSPLILPGPIFSLIENLNIPFSSATKLASPGGTRSKSLRKRVFPKEGERTLSSFQLSALQDHSKQILGDEKARKEGEV